MSGFSQSRSRRSLLLGVLGGVSGAVAASVATAGRALAAGNDNETVVVGGSYPDVRTETSFQNTRTEQVILSLNSHASTKEALGVIGNDAEAINAFGYHSTAIVARTASRPEFALDAEGPFVAIKGRSTATASSNGSAVGVFGTSASPDGAGVDGRSPFVGVHGESDGTGVQGDGTNGGIGVRGTAASGGIGVLGNSDTGRAVVGVVSASAGSTVGVMGESFSSTGTGVRGWGAGNGTGVYGFSGGTFPSNSVPRNTGVYGNAPTGRGGQFAGGKAQLRLVPSTAANHPNAGSAGDLFLDASHRLWLCKGGTSWTHLG